MPSGHYIVLFDMPGVIDMAQLYPPDLPPRYHILPESIDFIIPGFRRFYTPGDKTLALSRVDCVQWFEEFVDCLVAACGCRYLPVCRMSDGEFRFILGDQTPDVRLPWQRRIRQEARRIINQIRYPGKFQAFTEGHYHSGIYSNQERLQAQSQYARCVREISEKGILALHLSYGQVPFQEHYFPALRRWLQVNQIILSEENYVPFYFVYAALSGPRRSDLLRNRRLLVVNGAQGNKRQQIEEGLRREGAAEVGWLQISAMRSLYDRIDVAPYLGQVELALVGAGVGKPNILVQLEPLQVPCIDAGYLFEIWADPENKWERPVCATDCDYQER